MAALLVATSTADRIPSTSTRPVVAEPEISVDVGALIT
jgi:hypothetical protein